MKQILPILTLTTLSAAAFADAGAAAPAAAASGLVYNRVTVQQNTSGSTNRIIAVENLINGSNVLVGLTQSGGYAGGNISIGYVFKNVTNGIDATVNVTSGEYDGASVNLRRSLSEVLAGLELAVGYSHYEGSNNSWNYELSYNINKQFSVGFGAYDVSDSNQKFVALRYNY